MDKNFLFTTNKDSAELLEKMGFTLLSNSNNMWTFLNNKSLVFTNIKDVVPTNKICL